MLDYEVLRMIWWLLLGVLLIGFAIMDGFDMGVAILLPFVGKVDSERRVLFNSVGPVWEGNQVWLVLGAGAIFAAWPMVYATTFSGFYLAMLVILLALILRPVAFKFRSKMLSKTWRSSWDWALFISGLVPTLLFGVALGNVFLGVPFHFTNELRPIYTGAFLELLHPFALICGLVSVAMLCTHGASYIAMKTHDPIAQRARSFGKFSALLALLGFIFAGVWLGTKLPGFQLVGNIPHEGPSNPLMQPNSVKLVIGGWLNNYEIYPWTYLAPILAGIGGIFYFLMSCAKQDGLSFMGSTLMVFGIVATAGLSLYPFLLPSSTDLSQSLTLWNASSSRLTLQIMFIATVIFMPIILAYTAWVYRVMRGKVGVDLMQDRGINAY